MSLYDVGKIKNPFLNSIGLFFLFLILGFVFGVGMTVIGIKVFSSAFAYLSISLSFYLITQLVIMRQFHKKIKRAVGNRIEKVLLNSVFYWSLSLFLLVPFVYMVIPSVRLIGWEYDVNSVVKQILIILEFAMNYAPNQEISDKLLKFGIFSIIIPVITIISVVISIFSCYYGFNLKGLYDSELEEFEYQEAKKQKERKKIKDKKHYKWG